jgi:hypothetical protein
MNKTIPRITSRHFNKIRSGQNLLLSRVAALFRMINNTEEKNEEFIQETYTYGAFLLAKHIQDKIGEKLNKGNVYRNIPNRKRRLNEEIEGKDIEKDLNEAKPQSRQFRKYINRIKNKYSIPTRNKKKRSL